MTTLAVNIAASCISFAHADEWAGVAPLLPDLSYAHDAYAVPKLFALQASQGCVGSNAEAMVMAAQAGNAPVRLTSWPEHDAVQLCAPLLRAAGAELRRKRMDADRVLLVSDDDPGGSSCISDTLAIRCAGWVAPLRLPRAVCIAAAYATTDNSGTPIAVVQVGSDDLVLSEVRPDQVLPACRKLAVNPGGGWGGMWSALVEQLQQQAEATDKSAAQIRCEAQRLGRALLDNALQARSSASVPRLSLSQHGVRIEHHSTSDAVSGVNRWIDAMVAWLAPHLSSFRAAVVWVEDIGVPALATRVAGALQAATACSWRPALDPAQGAARLGAASIDLQGLARPYARDAQWNASQYGVLRPNGSGGTDFRALGRVPDLAVPQKLSLKTTREDQSRIVLPIVVQHEGRDPCTVAILEFPLAAPAKKGVLVEFHIEMAEPLLRIRGIAGSSASPVGEAFVPLDEGMAPAAAAYRSYLGSLGAVL